MLQSTSEEYFEDDAGTRKYDSPATESRTRELMRAAYDRALECALIYAKSPNDTDCRLAAIDAFSLLDLQPEQALQEELYTLILESLDESTSAQLSITENEKFAFRTFGQGCKHSRETNNSLSR